MFFIGTVLYCTYFEVPGWYPGNTGLIWYEIWDPQDMRQEKNLWKLLRLNRKLRGISSKYNQQNIHTRSLWVGMEKWVFRKLYPNSARLSRVKNKNSLFWQIETVSIIASIFSVKYPWISSLYIVKCSTYIRPNLLVTVIKINFLIWK